MVKSINVSLDCSGEETGSSSRNLVTFTCICWHTDGLWTCMGQYYFNYSNAAMTYTLMLLLIARTKFSKFSNHHHYR